MPKWWVHDKWATRLDIDRSCSKYVNNLIDFPEKNDEYIKFCLKKMGKSEKAIENMKKFIARGVMKEFFLGHDDGRVHKSTMIVQLEFLLSKFSDDDCISPFYLHHLLDMIDSSLEVRPIEETIQKFQIKLKNEDFSESRDEIIEFVRANSDDIIQDIKEQ